MTDRQQGSDATVTEQALEDGVFRLQDWFPYEFSLVANRVSSMLARMYSQRFGLSVSAWRVLAVLCNQTPQAPLSAKEVAERTAMNAVNVSRALSQLDRLGMIRRAANKADYRQVALTPSRKGEAAYAAVVPLAMAIESELLDGLKKSEIDALRKVALALARSAALRLPESRDWRELLPAARRRKST